MINWQNVCMFICGFKCLIVTMSGSVLWIGAAAVCFGLLLTVILGVVAHSMYILVCDPI